MIAFSYTFYYLKLELSYEEAIRRTLLLGGDTDTNAAIVGGLMGAYHGVDAIPEKWRNAVLNSQYKSEDFLLVGGKKKFYGLVKTLYDFGE